MWDWIQSNSVDLFGHLLTLIGIIVGAIVLVWQIGRQHRSSLELQKSGTNENTNGLLRQYYPKGTNFAKLSQAHINRVVEQLNNRPRKRLGYRTPAEVFWGEYSGAL